MAINALNTAANGLIASENRAAKLAENIVRASAKAASFSAEAANAPSQAPTSPANQPNSNPENSLAGLSPIADDQLIQNIVGLKSETIAFKANAAAFRRFDEIEDSLGRLLDEKS